MTRLTILFAFVLALSCNASKSAGVPIEGTQWVLVSYASIQTEGELKKATTEREGNLLMKDGQMNGSTGCNRYNGSYTLNDDQLEAGNIVMAKMFCQDAAEQESAFTTVMNAKPSMRVDDGQLILATAKGEQLVFRQADDVDQTDSKPTSETTSTGSDEKKN